MKQARNLSIVLSERSRAVEFLVRDRDTKFTASFDEVFRTEGIRLIKTPVRSPRANAIAERFVGIARRECLDRFPIFGRRHLEQVIAQYVAHYNQHRPHRALGQRAPGTFGVLPDPIDEPDPAQLRRNEILGGLINEYRLAARTGWMRFSARTRRSLELGRCRYHGITSEVRACVGVAAPMSAKLLLRR